MWAAIIPDAVCEGADEAPIGAVCGGLFGGIGQGPPGSSRAAASSLEIPLLKDSRFNSISYLNLGQYRNSTAWGPPHPGQHTRVQGVPGCAGRLQFGQTGAFLHSSKWCPYSWHDLHLRAILTCRRTLSWSLHLSRTVSGRALLNLISHRPDCFVRPRDGSCLTEST